MGLFTAEVPTEALREYAAARGLAYEEEGLLPPIASPLREALGVGSKLAGLLTRDGPHGYTAKGGFTRRPERHTFNLCRGTLPGGVEGVLAHHQHLEERSTSDGSTWVAAVDTVLVARLPERSRAVCELRAFPGGGGSMQALFSFDVPSGDAPLVMPGADEVTVTRGSHTFRLAPAEDAATVDALAGPDVLQALAHAPADTQVELVDGVLCVWARGIIEDDATLDAIAGVGVAIAAAVRATVARHGELDPARPLPAPPVTTRQQWLDAGVARVDWPQPPASVDDARRAYEPHVSERAARSGGRARLWILVAGLVLTFLWCVGTLIVWKLFGDDLTLVGIPIGIVYGLYKTVRVAWESGGETAAGEVQSQAWPWGLEAFARGYARARGLTPEDPDALRHTLASPLAGKPLRAMHGDLGGGVRGHVALWRDWANDAHWIVAVVPAPAGPVEAAPPYAATVTGASLVVGRQVTQDERSAAQLDALIAEARRLAAPAA